jgi:TetR/AcrR family tetracycline transcriptional repressor
MELALRKFVDAGFSPREATYAYRTIYCYAVGFTIEEQVVRPRPSKRHPRYDLPKRAERQQFPLALAAGKQMHKFDEQFEAGLQIIIRGLRK